MQLYRTTLTANDAQRLLDAHRPVVKLHSQERYYPCHVEWFLGHCGVTWEDHRTAWWATVEEVAETLDPAQIAGYTYRGDVSGVTTSRLADPRFVVGGTRFRLPVRGDTGAVYPGEGRTAAELATVPVYGLVVDQPAIRARDLVYCFFYAFNGYSMNDSEWWGEDPHEGDWEHIVMRVDAASEEILGIYYQAHGGGDPYSGWYNPPGGGVNVFQLAEAGRPLVYASREGHGSYVRADTWPYNVVRGEDETDDQGVEWGGPVVLIDPGLQAWVRYTGRMGGTIPSRNGEAPRSPLCQGWFAPRTDGPRMVSSVQVAAARLGAGFSSQFFVDVRGSVLWHMNPGTTSAGRLSCELSTPPPFEGPPPTSIEDGAVTSGKLGPRWVTHITYTDRDNQAYRDGDAFKKLGGPIQLTSIPAPFQSGTSMQPLVAIAREELAQVQHFVATPAADDQTDLYFAMSSPAGLSVRCLSGAHGYAATSYTPAIKPTDLPDVGAAVFGLTPDPGMAPDLYVIKTRNVDKVQVQIFDGSTQWQESTVAVTGIPSGAPITRWFVVDTGADEPDLAVISAPVNLPTDYQLTVFDGNSGFTSQRLHNDLPWTTTQPTQAFAGTYLPGSTDLFLFYSATPLASLVIYEGLGESGRLLVNQAPAPIPTAAGASALAAPMPSPSGSYSDLLIVTAVSPGQVLMLRYPGADEHPAAAARALQPATVHA